MGTTAESNSSDEVKVRSKTSMFWSLLRESVILQGAITLCVVITVCYLALVSQPIPDLLAQGMMLILGFFFGAKSVVQRKE